jgi:F-type H+-transporting ATPase subunit epsilon
MRLNILVPDSVALSAAVSSLQAQDASGRFGLLPHHQPFLTLLVPCVLFFKDEQGRERYAAIDGGVLLSEGDKVEIVTREAAVADRLEEVADKAAAMLEARRLLEQTARMEFSELQTSLLRELRRMEARPT